MNQTVIRPSDVRKKIERFNTIQNSYDKRKRLNNFSAPGRRGSVEDYEKRIANYRDFLAKYGHIRDDRGRGYSIVVATQPQTNNTMNGTKRYTPDNINSLNPGEILVFGSNVMGIHGAGAAKTALRFGAIWNQGTGLMGQTYGIPTKKAKFEILTPSEIQTYVDEFVETAKNNPQLTFLVTKVGCGYAGYTPDDMAPLFSEAAQLPNVVIPEDFDKVLNP